MIVSKRLKDYGARYKGVFLTGVVLALAVHLYFFTNTLPNYDTLVTQYSYNFGLSLGRWTNFFGSILSSAYALPWVTGVLCCLYLGLTCVLICDVLELRSRWARVLACGLITAFPALASNFSFLFIADSGAMGMLFAALSVKLCKDFKWGVPLGGIALGFATGFYQAHLCFGMVLMALTFGMQILSGRLESNKALLRTAGKYLLTAIIGMLAYYAGFRLCLLVTGFALPNSYQDIGALLAPSINLRESISIAVAEISRNFTGSLPFLERLRLPLLILWALCELIGTVSLVCVNGLYKKPLHLAALILLLPLTCVALTAPSFISTQVGYHSVMRLAWSLLFVGMVVVMELVWNRVRPELRSDTASIPKSLRPAVAYRVVTIFTAVIIIWNFWIVTNLGYLSMQHRYEHDYANMLRAVDRLEQQEDYKAGTPVVFLGVSSLDSGLFSHDPAVGQLAGMSGGTMLVYPSVYNDFAQYYLGVDLPYPGDETAALLRADPEVTALSCWPEKNCMALLDGVYVVKMSN